MNKGSPRPVARKLIELPRTPDGIGIRADPQKPGGRRTYSTVATERKRSTDGNRYSTGRSTGISQAIRAIRGRSTSRHTGAAFVMGLRCSGLRPASPSTETCSSSASRRRSAMGIARQPAFIVRRDVGILLIGDEQRRAAQARLSVNAALLGSMPSLSWPLSSHRAYVTHRVTMTDNKRVT